MARAPRYLLAPRAGASMAALPALVEAAEDALAPGIPRGGFVTLTPLLLAVGLPVEGVGILIAVDAIPDTLATVLNVTGNLVATVLVAHRSRTWLVQ